MNLGYIYMPQPEPLLGISIEMEEDMELIIMIQQHLKKRTCQTCSKTFYVKASVVARGLGKYCSNKCKSVGLSKRLKGIRQTEEVKAKISVTLMGHQVSDISRKKMSESAKKAVAEGRSILPRDRGFTGTLGMKYSAKSKAKMSIAAKRRIQEKPHTMPNPTGHKVSEESRAKMSKAKIGIYVGEKSYNWKGGITPLQRAVRTCANYVKWKRRVLKRDNYTCVKCAVKKGDLGVVIHVNHIKAFIELLDEYNIRSVAEANVCKELWNVDNGEVLCWGCHKKTDNYGNRKQVNVCG